ncbi:GAK5 protein, partial [Passerina amoena]|nr:GAK5 protein [Passerina amoena]
IDPIRNKPDITITDFVKTCAHIGAEQYSADLLAAALAQQLQVAWVTIKCFDCEEEGRVRKQCPKNEQRNKKRSRPCPRCKKSYHGYSQCCSKFDQDGRPLPKQGNLKRGLGTCTPQQKKTQPQLLPT